MNCPKCKNVVGARFREKPKGEKAKFLCFDCLPEDYRQALIDKYNRRVAEAENDDDNYSEDTFAILI
jgi:hypothetical protein